MLYLLCGPIASGKSTHCRKAAQDGAIIVNDDAIVTLCHGGNYGLYSKKLKRLYKSIETHIITSALLMGRDVIVDRPCHRRATRQRYIELARSMDVDAVVLTTKREKPEVHAKRRVESDSRGHDYGYWLGVAQAHDALWQEPSAEIENYAWDQEIKWEMK